MNDAELKAAETKQNRLLYWMSLQRLQEKCAEVDGKAPNCLKFAIEIYGENMIPWIL